MNKFLLAGSLMALGFGATMALTPSAARAANADNPYGNVDRSNDAGNNTGDSRVDNLNANQLNQNYQGTVQPRAPSGPVVVYPGPPGPPPPPPPGSVIVR
jgi:hypothetical protein